MDCETQLGKLIAAIGKDSVSMVVEALPKTILTMTACTGSGMLEIVLEVVVKELNQQFGCELEVRVGNTFRVFWIVLSWVKFLCLFCLAVFSVVYFSCDERWNDLSCARLFRTSRSLSWSTWSLQRRKPNQLAIGVAQSCCWQERDVACFFDDITKVDDPKNRSCLTHRTSCVALLVGCGA